MDTDTGNKLTEKEAFWRAIALSIQADFLAVERQNRLNEGAARILARRILYLLRGEGSTDGRPALVPPGRAMNLPVECVDFCDSPYCTVRCKKYRKWS